MAELKTKPNEASVAEFLAGIADDKMRADCQELVKIMKQITKCEPKMWGGSMVGFGEYHYKYASGREADWFLTGFSPRKQNLTLYIMAGFDQYTELLAALGKHSVGKSCLYVKGLDTLHIPTLKKMIKLSVAHMKSLDK